MTFWDRVAAAGVATVGTVMTGLGVLYLVGLVVEGCR